MPQKKKVTHRKRVQNSVMDLGCILKALRPGLRKAFDRIAEYALAGAGAFDWLDRNKPKAPRARSSKSKSAQSTSSRAPKKKEGPSPRLREPGPIERRGKKWVNPGLPNNLDHIPVEDRDLARLELLRACHDGPEAFVAKREELMKRFKIDLHPKREIIMGAFWGHLNGHRRKKFVERVLAMASSQGKRRDKILGDLAKLYRVPRKKLTFEVDAQPTLH